MSYNTIINLGVQTMSYNNSLEGKLLLSLLGIEDTSTNFQPPIVYPHFMENNELELEVECAGENGKLLAEAIEKWLLENDGNFVKLNDNTVLVDSNSHINSLLTIFIGVV